MESQPLSHESDQVFHVGSGLVKERLVVGFLLGMGFVVTGNVCGHMTTTVAVYVERFCCRHVAFANSGNNGRIAGTNAVWEVAQLGKATAAGSVGRQDNCSGKELREGRSTVAEAVVEPTMEERFTGCYHGWLSFAPLFRSEPLRLERLSGEMKIYPDFDVFGDGKTLSSKSNTRRWEPIVDSRFRRVHEKKLRFPKFALIKGYLRYNPKLSLSP